MYSYTTGRNFYGRLTNASDTTHLTNGDELINQSINVILSLKDWPFLELLESVSTVDGQRFYEIPANVRDTLDEVYVDVSNTIYMPHEVDSAKLWSVILSRQSGESERQEFWYRRGSQVGFDPIPDSSSNTIYFVGRKLFGKLQNADYTTGAVSVAVDGTTVTGVGTTFTSAMVGRYISFDDGDNLLYEIDSFTSTTEIELVKPYQGSAAVSGSDFVIGEYSPLPAAFQSAPIYRAAAIYWGANGDQERANQYWAIYDGGKEIGQREDYGGLIGSMYKTFGKKSEGGYLSPLNNVILRDPNVPPTTIAQSNFT